MHQAQSILFGSARIEDVNQLKLYCIRSSWRQEKSSRLIRIFSAIALDSQAQLVFSVGNIVSLLLWHHGITKMWNLPCNLPYKAARYASHSCIMAYVFPDSVVDVVRSWDF